MYRKELLSKICSNIVYLHLLQVDKETGCLGSFALSKVLLIFLGFATNFINLHNNFEYLTYMDSY